MHIIHIVEETAKAIKKKGYKKAGHLGTKFTMKMDFYRNKLAEYGLDVLTPGTGDERLYSTYSKRRIRNWFY